MSKKPRVIDAKFEVVKPEYDGPPWWRRLYIDWTTFLIIAFVSVAATVRWWLSQP